MAQRSLDTAAKSGNIDLLYELIHEDPYVLDKIDQMPFVDTPLHVAAAAGQTAFAMEIMNWKPSFARKPNADGLTPLHLAVDHHHYGFVLEVVKFDPSLVRLKGRQGMTPLLEAVSRKKIDLVSEFFLACPESIVDANVNGENALHIAVQNNDQGEGLKVLKVLMGWILRLCQKDARLIETRVINRRDKDGNTPLHLAAYENNLEATKQMVKSSMINVNIENNVGLTVREIAVSHKRGDIERQVKRHGRQRLRSFVKIKTASDLLGSPPSWSESRRTRLIRSYSWMSEQRRNALLIVATLIITATYQTALQPPGGVKDKGESVAPSGGVNSNTERASLVGVYDIGESGAKAPSGGVYYSSESGAKAPAGGVYDYRESYAVAPGPTGGVEHSVADADAPAPAGDIEVGAGTVVMTDNCFFIIWLSNSVGFYLATAMMLRMLSLGEESGFWYYPLFVPLLLAYFFAGIVIAPTWESWVLACVGSIVILLLWRWFVSSWEWMQSKLTKLHEPKSGLIWEGFTTFDQAKGIAPKGYVVKW